MTTSSQDGPAGLNTDGLMDMDPKMASLFQMLNGSSGADPMAVLMSQWQDQIQSDPRTAQIFNFLEQQRRRQAENAADDGQAYELSEGSAAPPQTDRATDYDDDAQLLMEDLYTELEVLRSRNDVLAAALGACHLCFGTDPHCTECHGRGVAGSRAPEPLAFRRYVVPALRRAKSVESQRNKRSAATSPPAVKQPTEGANEL